MPQADGTEALLVTVQRLHLGNTVEPVDSQRSCETSLALFHHLTNAFAASWRATSGPLMRSLVSRCCRTFASNLFGRTLESLALTEFIPALTAITDQLQAMTPRYKNMLLPLLHLHLMFQLSKLPDMQPERSLGNQFLPNLLAFLLRHHAEVEVRCIAQKTNLQAETLVELWLDFVYAKTPGTGAERKMETQHLPRSMRTWLQHRLQLYFEAHPELALGWLHKDVLELFADEPFALQSHAHRILHGTKPVLHGVFGAIEQVCVAQPVHTCIPIPLLYDQLAREITRRVCSAWSQSKKEASALAKRRHVQYLLQLTYLVSRHAMGRHAPLVVVAIELAILTMLCLSTQHDTVSPHDLLQSAHCAQCQTPGQGCAAHGQLVKLIDQLYRSQEGVTLQSVMDSPHSSPLRALSVDGLDVGHTFLLVSKLMRWHELALAEAQALSVCAEWISATDVPYSREFFERMSALQADAEKRALCTLSPDRSDYVYDDVIDAYVLRDASAPAVPPAPKRTPLVARSMNDTPPARPTPMPSKIPPLASDDDEFDVLRVNPARRAARVCRTVQRLDVRKETARQTQRRMCAKRRRSSLLPYL